MMNGLLTRPPTTPAMWLQAPATPEPVAPPTGTTVPITPGRPRRWPLLAGVAGVAALCGLGAGVLITLPQRNELTDQRDAARVEVADVEDELDEALASLDGLRVELAALEDAFAARGVDLDEATAQLATTIASLDAMTSERDTVTTNRDECLLAATAAVDLVDQWENLWDDEYAWLMTAVGSVEEAEIDAHMVDQLATMEQQHEEMHQAFSACTNG
jgi:uncharacterized protein HemX